MTRYQLLERIGVGGMAEVFRGVASAVGGFEKPVAIKRILPHLSSDKRFVEALVSEAKLLSQLRHRNIVQIFDLGLGSDGQYFLVMELVDGADLGALATSLKQRRKRLPLGLALHIGAEVCEALEFAHRAQGSDGKPLKLVHRDVSPANILLSKSGEVKLTDFGIAKRAEEVTGHGAVRGKFAYISPEQAVSGRVDARSDVFSLAIVLYELLLGRPLYSAMPDYEALRELREGKIPAPGQVDREFPAELERIILRGLALAPGDRYPSARKFGSALRGFRYAMPDTGGDPAAEIGRILERYCHIDDRDEGEEATVVRITTAAGFSTARFELKAFGDDLTTQDLDVDDEEDANFDEAETVAIGGRLGAGTLGKSHPGLDEILGALPLKAASSDPHTDVTVRRQVPSMKRSKSSRGSRSGRDKPLPPGFARANTPTIRDLYYDGKGPDRVEESPVTAMVPKLPWGRSSDDEEGGVGALTIAAVVVALLVLGWAGSWAFKNVSQSPTSAGEHDYPQVIGAPLAGRVVNHF